MKKKTKVIASALTTIALCLSLAVGGTFALFTSESQVAVNIVTGTVNVTANADEESLTLYSPTSINSDGTINNATNAATTTAFANGGTATLEGGEITLDRMTAGDKATFNIVIHNGSNVKVKYRTVIKVTEDTGLFSGLTITVGGVAYNGATTYSQWANADSADITVPVAVELPANAGNAYQNKSCKISYSVEAVQGNVVPEIPEANVVYIYTATDLRLFEKSVNNGGNTYANKTVKLMNDVDLAGADWTPIGQTGATQFQGTFDGQGKTIKNMTVNNPDEGRNCASGFFGWIEDHGIGIKVQNVKFENASVTGNHNVGVVVGYIYGTIENCEVKNSTVVANNANDDANGDKVGGIVGMVGEDAFINNNKVINCTIIGNRDIGGIAGAINMGIDSFTGNSVSDTNIAYETVKDYGSAGAIVSGRTGFAPDATNVATDVTIIRQITVSTAEKLSVVLNATYNVDTTIVLANDIDLGGAEWGAHALKAENNAALTIDGNGKTITGLTTSEYTNVNGFNSNGLVTAIMSSLSSVTFKNLTVSGATLTNNGGLNAASGVFVGDINTVKVTFENCTVTGANVTSDAYAAGFIGYVQDVYNTDPSLSCPVTLKDCTVTGSTFKGKDATGAMIGLNNGATIINGATVTGNTINGGAGYSAAALVGTSIGGTTATDVTASGNTFIITNTNYEVSNATYGYVFKNGKTYTVNGTALN